MNFTDFRLNCETHLGRSMNRHCYFLRAIHEFNRAASFLPYVLGTLENEHVEHQEIYRKLGIKVAISLPSATQHQT